MRRDRISFLLIEDDRVDVMTVQRALKAVKITTRLEVAGDGEEALAMLRSPDRQKPDIILLDLNMPRMNGLEFLRVVKRDPKLKIIPVIVLTTSQEEQDRIDSFSLGVAGYMVKPVDYLQFVQIMDAIHLYWTLSELPT
jgi:CheY-like chemotaxis protein